MISSWPAKIRQMAKNNPKRLIYEVLAKSYNTLLDLKGHPKHASSEFSLLNEVIEFSHRERTDINEHLVTLFAEALSVSPSLIVELGVRGGASTFVLERVAQMTGAVLVSVDIVDCSNVSSYERWHFVEQDDITYAAEFKSWCADRHIDPRIEVLFIDTSHKYEHTVQEIEKWFPFLAENAKVIFHDTHMQLVYFRYDGSIGVGWDNTRGVIAALEKHFQRSFNEAVNFVDVVDGWLIKHDAHSSGFTVLEKIDLPGSLPR